MRRRRQRRVWEPREQLDLEEAERLVRHALEADADRWDVYRFVLEHGRARRPVERPADVSAGERHDAFGNAYRLARSRPDLSYCEGYTLARGWDENPNRHAWCADADDNAIDPSPGWTEPGTPLRDCYFGVAIPLDLAERHLPLGVLYEYTGRAGDLRI